MIIEDQIYTFDLKYKKPNATHSGVWDNWFLVLNSKTNLISTYEPWTNLFLSSGPWTYLICSSGPLTNLICSFGLT